VFHGETSVVPSKIILKNLICKMIVFLQLLQQKLHDYQKNLLQMFVSMLVFQKFVLHEGTKKLNASINCANAVSYAGKVLKYFLIILDKTDYARR